MTERIFICGASRGIGLELAGLFRGEGHSVYGIARSPQPQREIEGLVYRSLPAQAFALSAFPELMEQTLDKVILNSAIFGPPSQFSLDFPPNMLQSMFETNVVAHLRVLRELKPRIKTGAQVSFVISRGGIPSTIRGRVGIGYRSTKAAQIALALSLVHPLTELGISTYLINPGSAATRIGGAQARFTALESAQSVKATMERAHEHPSGTIFDYDGSVVELHIKQGPKVPARA